MGRISRHNLLFDDCYAHVFSRSFNGMYLFREELEFEMFKVLLSELKVEYGFKIHHYCLMNTHFHLLVSISNVHGFSEALAQIKSKYTKWVNRKMKRNGPLWRDRFKSMLVENESYLYACGLYIENNPVRAGMVKRPGNWAYSSSGYYVSNREDALLDKYDNREVPAEIDLSNSRFFEKGKVIGTKLFQIQMEDIISQAVTVP
ncbi:MAG: hypothetical protein A3E74_07980 [Omnitrophica bacterium RIFCSPHIGHO2_12_FULL_44_12]|nr:MAG: hypothetical protein A3E74_07980 [Omnitrophica bacterium RIFCSPHIGHO2_12_FULL_44_12]